MGCENSGVIRAAQGYFRRVKALRTKALLAVILGALALPGLMARAFPHECHSAVGADHGHDSAWLTADCSLCDLAMPVAEAPSHTAMRLLLLPHPIQRVDALPRMECASAEGSDARGPPRA